MSRIRNFLEDSFDGRGTGYRPGRRVGSDHFALFTELVLEGKRGEQQSNLKANEDDLAWAKDKADDQVVSKEDVTPLETD